MDEQKNELTTNEPKRRRRNAAQEKAFEEFRIAQENEAANDIPQNVPEKAESETRIPFDQTAQPKSVPVNQKSQTVQIVKEPK